ncbi:MAG: alkaline phosphatase [Pseudomonadota bacterium]
MTSTHFLALAVLGSLFAGASCATQPSDMTTQTRPVSDPAKGSAKNIILMVSDGIGFNGWLAADYYQGLAGKQSYQTKRPDGTQPVVYGMSHFALNLVDDEGKPLESKAQLDIVGGAVEQGYDPTTRWKKMENAFLGDFATGDDAFRSYTDSAAAGTALMAGRKTSNGRINLDWSGEEEFETIAEIAMKKGRATGAVASVMVSHATPASVVAHNISRGNYAEIFNEMASSGLDVIMGGGHPLFDVSGRAVDPVDETSFQFVGGPDTYASLTSDQGLNGYTFIDQKADFEALATGGIRPQRLVGVARTATTLQAARQDLPNADTLSGVAFNPEVPNLATMSRGALNVLSQDKDGFFLMIEGGAVDWMGHANNMPRFIEEQVDFNLAIDAVIEWVEANSSWDETLLIVTADHETGGIWGEGTWTNSEGGPVAATFEENAVEAARYHPDEDVFNDFLAVQDKGAGVLPGYQFASGNHTNELVPLWAIGAGAEHFAEFARTDVKAAEIWGQPYGWNGNYIDNTSVFFVMERALHADE